MDDLSKYEVDFNPLPRKRENLAIPNDLLKLADISIHSLVRGRTCGNGNILAKIARHFNPLPRKRENVKL